jgi:hypothetical protein
VLVANSIKDLRPNPQETSALYLGIIIQLLADTNVSSESIPSNVVQPPPFRPHRYAVLVNSLWFLSLAISITSALLATLLQQWARRYLKVTHTQDKPKDRARVRALFFEGADKFHLLWIADTVPALIHLSLTLFFAALLILLWDTHHTVFFSVVWWVVILAVGYAYITLLPFVRSHSLCYGPLPSLAWQLYATIQYVSSKAPSIVIVPKERPVESKDNRHERLLGRVEKNAMKKASESSRSSKICASILESIIDALHDDYDTEQFFGAMPGFYRPKAGKIFSPSEFELFSAKYVRSLNGFLDRTLSSDSIPDWVRSSRLFICLNAANVVVASDLSSQITHRIIHHDSWYEVPSSAEKAYVLRLWTRSNNKQSFASGKCIVARIIAKAWKRDDTWRDLAMGQLGVSEAVLESYLTHGNSVLLANLIKIADVFFETKFPYHDVLGSVSKFSVEGILPELQHKFCTLWNEIVEDAGSQSESSGHSSSILENIRDIFNALHPDDPRATIPVTQDEDRLPSASNYLLYQGPNQPTPHQPTSTSHTYQTVPHQGTTFTTAEPSIQLVLIPLPLKVILLCNTAMRRGSLVSQLNRTPHHDRRSLCLCSMPLATNLPYSSINISRIPWS